MIKMDNIHGGSWKKLQNWATGLFLKKTADSDLNMNGYNVNNAGNLAPAGYGLGEAEGRTINALTDLNRYGFYFLPSNKGITPTNNANWGGVYIGATTSYGTLIAGNASGLATLARNASWGTEWQRISTFPYGNTSLDNRINAFGSNYIRYENGLQICWGYAPFEEGASTKTITFSQPFANTNYRISLTAGVSLNARLGFGNTTTSGFTVYRYALTETQTALTTGTGGFQLIAIGNWK